jgi:molybdopterin molybdotransferase
MRVIEGVPFIGLPLDPVRFPREGTGLLSSSDSDGVVELGEDLTRVEPGQIVLIGFTYASLP